jgi:two-component system, OmpR family, response regulator
MNATDLGLITVVYVEDDVRLAQLTASYLGSHGVEVVVIARGDTAVSEILRLSPDLVLLDLMVPGLNGVEVCKRLRERTSIPILMITARTEEADRVLGLEAGADDYVHKPFSSRELLARIRAAVRRARGLVGPAVGRIVLGDLVVDSVTMTATVSGKRINLTTTEFDLLRVLAERSGRVLSREQLLGFVQNSADDAFDRSIDVLVSRLRAKLEQNPKQPRYLKTVRGAGYTLVSDES